MEKYGNGRKLKNNTAKINTVKKITVEIMTAAAVACLFAGCGTAVPESEEYIGAERLNQAAPLTAGTEPDMGENETASAPLTAEVDGTEEEVEGTVLEDTDIFSRPSQEASRIGHVTQGESITIIGSWEEEGWRRVSYNGRVAYVRTEALEISSPAGTTSPEEGTASTPPASVESPTPTGNISSGGNASPTASPVPTIAPTVTPSPTASPVPTIAPTVAPSPTASPVPTATPEPTASPTPTVTPEPTASPTPTVTPEPTASPAPTVTPEPTEPGESSAPAEPSEPSGGEGSMEPSNPAEPADPEEPSEPSDSGESSGDTLAGAGRTGT